MLQSWLWWWRSLTRISPIRCKLYLSDWDIPICMHLYSYSYAARLNHISISLFLDSNFSQACQHCDERLQAVEWIKPINGSSSFDFSVVVDHLYLDTQMTEKYRTAMCYFRCGLLISLLRDYCSFSKAFRWKIPHRRINKRSTDHFLMTVGFIYL